MRPYHWSSDEGEDTDKDEDRDGDEESDRDEESEQGLPDRLIYTLPQTLKSLYLQNVTSKNYKPVLELMQDDLYLLPNLRIFYTDIDSSDGETLRKECMKHDTEYFRSPPQHELY